MNPGYKIKPLSFERQMVRASASVTRRRNVIHSMTEVDVSVPRGKLKEHFEQTGEKLSFTGYLVACLAKVIEQHPGMNSFIRGRKLVLLEEINISVLIEREIRGESIPEPLVIRNANGKSLREITQEIRKAQENAGKELGSLSKMTWVRFVPGFLLKTFIRLADKNIRMATRYGKVAVTAMGMFSREPFWFIPHGTGTLLMTVGSIVNRVVETASGFESREHLSLTLSFDHDIIDGAPAARFVDELSKEIKRGEIG
jgi:pyruvate/2-oxoglutarate dehydrogenase complex dihydrolipoamide acyltransferase (E2) component